MGKGSSGSTTTQVSSNSPPPDVTAQYDNLIAQANAQSAQPLQQYQANIVAPLTQYQNQAGNEVANLQGSSQPLYNQAQGLIQNASQQITPQTVNAADIQQYQNPYTQQVINSTMANINQQDAGQQQQLIGNAASQGAWGGDRSAVAQALLANQQDLANNQTISGLENQSYSQALGEANTQQQAGLSAQEASQYLGQQGGAALTNLGNQELSAGLTGAAALNSAGSQQQQQTQEQLNVPYEQFLQQQAFPYQNLSWLSSLSTGLGSNLGGTSTSSTTQPAPNSIFGFKRGGHVEGLIKRLATGGAIMMPEHFADGGSSIIPGAGFDVTQSNSGIPNLDPNIFAGDPMTLTKGNGLPTSHATPTQQSSAMDQISQMTGIAGGLSKLGGGSGSSGSSGSAGGLLSMFGGSNGVNTASSPTSGAVDNPLDLSSGSSLSSSDLGSISSAFGNYGTDTAASDAGSSAASSGMLSSLGDALMSIFKKGGAVTPNKYAFGGNVLPDIVSGIGDVVGAWFGDPMAGSQFTGALSQIDGGETKPGLQLSMLKRGGLVKHYDGGGGVTPFDTSTNPMANNMASQFANMSTQQLQQVLPRVQNPMQKQVIQKVLQQKQVMPNAGGLTNAVPSAPMAPQASMKRGGLIKHYDDGGDIPLSDALTADDASLAPQASTQPVTLTGATEPPAMSADNVAKMAQLYPDAVPSSSADTNAAPSGLIKPSAGGTGPITYTPPPAPVYHDDKPTNEVNPWLSVAAGVAGALAGKSPYVLQNVAAGALGGLENYGAQKKEAADEIYKNGSIQDARAKLEYEAGQHTADEQKQAKEFQAQQDLDAQKQAEMAQYHQGELGRQNAALGLQRLEATKPVFDKAGNPWQLDSATGKYVQMAKGQIGSGQNIYGYDVGSVPQGTSAPVLDSKYDPTLGMPATQKAVYDSKVQQQLEKDNAAAAANNDAIARLQASKNTIVTAPTGGITNLLGIDPVATAFSTQRQEMDALNKELAMSPGERPANMRLTQGEVMMLKQAQPGTDKSPEANAAIADAGIAIRSRPSEFANFKNDFVANNGYWNDAVGQQMYNQYVKENPIIDVAKSGKGTIALNPNRQAIEQYANNGGFAKYGVKGNPQANQQPAASSGNNVSAAPQSGAMVKVSSPTGQTGMISQAELADAQKNGWKVIQ